MQEDITYEQMSLKEYIDQFTDQIVNKGKSVSNKLNIGEIFDLTKQKIMGYYHYYGLQITHI